MICHQIANKLIRRDNIVDLTIDDIKIYENITNIMIIILDQMIIDITKNM